MTILRLDRRVVRRVTPALLAGLRAPIKSVAVDRTPAATALTRTLENGPVTIFALGPLTNAAHVLTTSPHLVSNVDELMAVMGRRPGHLFHPSEGIGRGSLLGHGPVFRDFTFSGDPEAAEQLLCLGRERFYPFDLMAAGYLLAPSLFRCADVPAWVGKDPILFAPLFRALALLVEPNRTHPARRTTYCPEVERECAARLHEWISAPS